MHHLAAHDLVRHLKTGQLWRLIRAPLYSHITAATTAVASRRWWALRCDEDGRKLAGFDPAVLCEADLLPVGIYCGPLEANSTIGERPPPQPTACCDAPPVSRLRPLHRLRPPGKAPAMNEDHPTDNPPPADHSPDYLAGFSAGWKLRREFELPEQAAAIDSTLAGVVQEWRHPPSDRPADQDPPADAPRPLQFVSTARLLRVVLLLTPRLILVWLIGRPARLLRAAAIAAAKACRWLRWPRWFYLAYVALLLPGCTMLGVFYHGLTWRWALSGAALGVVIGLTHALAAHGWDRPR